MSNVYARVSNGLVREVIYFDPQGDFTPNLTWVQVSNSITTGANVSGGNIYVVQPRWKYDGMMFTPPAPQAPIPRPSGHATYRDKFAMIGHGANVWTEICNVSIIVNTSTAHFLSYSTDVYDVNLHAYSTQILLPNGNTQGGSGYGGGELAGINGGSAIEVSAGGIGLGLDAVAAALDAAAAAAAFENAMSAAVAGLDLSQSGETGGSPIGNDTSSEKPNNLT